MDRNEYMDLDHFDREYGLADLLPVDLAAVLLDDPGREVEAAVLFPDGRVLYETCAGEPWPLPEAREAGIDGLSGEKAIALPLTHEMETIGFFCLRQTASTPAGLLQTIGRFAQRSMNTVLRLNYQNLMTAGLHGQVVEDSYTRLKEKAEQLRISEAKYRNLAQNLEVEVARKTEKIKHAQLLLLQQEKLAAVGQLAAGMAHEINNPIGFIISNLNTFDGNTEDLCLLLEHFDRLADFCRQPNSGPADGKAIAAAVGKVDALRRKLDLDFMMDDTRALVAESLEGARRIKTIVQNLREFAHPGVDKPETVNVNHCLDITLSMLENRIGDGIDITRKYKATRLVTCYLRDINQVFFNVIQNAVQAVGQSGKIVVSTCDCDDNSVEIAVGDTGAGIPEAHLNHIYDPFFTTRDVGGGTGLGLYLVFTLVKKHDGVISVESKEGAGSIFRIRMPAGGGSC